MKLVVATTLVFKYTQFSVQGVWDPQ